MAVVGPEQDSTVRPVPEYQQTVTRAMATGKAWQLARHARTEKFTFAQRSAESGFAGTGLDLIFDETTACFSAVDCAAAHIAAIAGKMSQQC